jgi:ABC-2 type transport system permease protein
VVRGVLLKGQTLPNLWPELAALAAFVCVVTALAISRYRRTLD